MSQCRNSFGTLIYQGFGLRRVDDAVVPQCRSNPHGLEGRTVLQEHDDAAFFHHQVICVVIYSHSIFGSEGLATHMQLDSDSISFILHFPNSAAVARQG